MNPVNGLLNLSPTLVGVGGVLYALVRPSYPAFLFSTGVFSILLLNLGFKCASKKLLYPANTTHLPLLGRGMRPDGHEHDAPMEFGMPSGHARFQPSGRAMPSGRAETSRKPRPSWPGIQKRLQELRRKFVHN